ncbi:MAG TPA: enoyl-CoA hydratase-related protein [Vicinamibacterales bacterium]
MGFRYLDVRREGAVEYLTLNRPDVRNAFNDGMIAELTWWADAAAKDATLRAVVLAGAGPVFCAGADLEWMRRMAAYSHEQNLDDAHGMATMFMTLDRLPVPLVGRVHGAALGGGTGLVAVCDIVVAEEGVQFGFTEVKLGLIPAVIGPFVLAKIGRSAARELFLTGARFDAARAKAIGLVHAVVPSDRLDATVDEYVREVVSGAPGAIAAAKRLIADLAKRSPSDTAAVCAEAIAERRASEEGREGIAAFLEKRTPRW